MLVSPAIPCPPRCFSRPRDRARRRRRQRTASAKRPCSTCAFVLDGAAPARSQPRAACPHQSDSPGALCQAAPTSCREQGDRSAYRRARNRPCHHGSGPGHRRSRLDRNYGGTDAGCPRGADTCAARQCGSHRCARHARLQFDDGDRNDETRQRNDSLRRVTILDFKFMKYFLPFCNGMTYGDVYLFF